MDSKIRNITHNNQLYATIFDTKNIKEGLDFLTNDESFIQVGTWNYKKGKVLDAHFHNEFERKAFRTQEIVFVLDGMITCNLYTQQGEFITSEKIEKNCLIIQYQGVHEYEIDKDSKILEVKNGPYFGPEKDRTRVDVKKD
jgi:oxalate decarboxylase/phosphoglucose isomerase-like protein (cupin superfamily)